MPSLDFNINTDINFTQDMDFTSMTREQLIERIVFLEEKLKRVNEPQPKKLKVYKTGRPFDFNRFKQRHIALKILYLGWDFSGFVVQDNSTGNSVGNSVEDHLFKALVTTRLIESRQKSNYNRSGRTDIGVSAFSQVISISVRSKSLVGQEMCDPEDELNYPFLLNRALPPGIQCICWSPAKKDSFSARFDCISRTYRYYFPRSSLNIDLMRSSAKYFEGEHNFKNLCKEDHTKNIQKTTVKKVLKTNIFPVDQVMEPSPQDMMVFEITSHGFLWHQIRCIMSILFLVGEGKESPEITRRLVDTNEFKEKPQYQLASGLALNLFNCDFSSDDIGKWIGDETALVEVLENLQRQWTEFNVKTKMIENIMQRIREEFCVDVVKFHDCLSFEKSKFKHKLLSDRPVCRKKVKKESSDNNLNDELNKN